MSTSDEYSDRLLELLAAQQLGDLSHEEHEELNSLMIEVDNIPDEIMGELLVMLDRASPDQEEIPVDLANRLSTGGKAAVAATAGLTPLNFQKNVSQSKPNRWAWMTSAAAIIAIGATVFGISNYYARVNATNEYTTELAALESKISANAALLEQSRLAASNAQQMIDELELSNQAQAIEIAKLDQTRLDMATQLADATSSLENARDTIAIYETPLDPAQLAVNRTQLLEVPDAIQVAWQPFDLPDSPAEQQGVRGDVVWSDELQEGYIRFVGLEPNDPDVQQYQIWVIDERGLEQKVSGGVFNASAEGEIIVPITPGIDVGRVALFAITVEDPGGTWVPDLTRRVVVAPRDS
tara:strand:+ start:30540 stop:31598 length:1059 start_codon:yes stop_codon:yes gene_type:complete